MRFLSEVKYEKSRAFRIALMLQVFIIFCYSSPSFSAITKIQDATKCQTDLCWEISGEIVKSDLQDLARAVSIMSKTKATPLFRLNSRGGDVETAIAIGRQLRKYHATAIAWDQGGCYSSCVFIFAGAVRRSSGSSSIGIHRPYFNTTNFRDYEQIQADQRRLAKIAKEYLEEVNVLPSLYDAMISIPPERIRMLSESELQQYGLSEIDPAEQELFDTAEARRRGISKGEFMKRKAQVNVSCANAYKYGAQSSNFEQYFKCAESVLSGHR